MDGPTDYHTKQSKSDRKKQIYDTTYMWKFEKMIQMYLFTKEKQAHRHRKQLPKGIVGWQGVGVGQR